MKRSYIFSVSVLCVSSIISLFFILSPSYAIGPFGNRVPFGGKISFVCSCSCTGETLYRIDQPSAFTWPEDKEEFFLTGSYTRFRLKNEIDEGEWTVGLAQEPKQACLVLTIVGCVSCGSGYPINYIGTDQPQTGFEDEPNAPTSKPEDIDRSNEVPLPNENNSSNNPRNPRNPNNPDNSIPPELFIK